MSKPRKVYPLKIERASEEDPFLYSWGHHLPDEFAAAAALAAEDELGNRGGLTWRVPVEAVRLTWWHTRPLLPCEREDYYYTWWYEERNGPGRGVRPVTYIYPESIAREVKP